MKKLILALTAILAVALVSANPHHSVVARKKAAGGGSDLPPTTAVIAWWALEEATGDNLALDSTANNNDFTSADYPTFTSGGKVGNARDFEVTNNNYELLADAGAGSFEFGDEDFSMCGWFKMESDSTTKTILSKYGNASNNEWLLWEDDTGTGKVAFAVSPDGSALTEAAITNPGLSVETWYFLYAEYDSVANLIGISLDDSALTTASFSGALYNGAADVVLGAMAAGTVWKMDGELDEIAVFNRTLTAAEVTALYNSGSGVTYTDL